MPLDFGLKGKVALVTGGSRGLGAAIARGFAEAGAHVAVVSRKLDACQAIANEIGALGVRAFPYACHIGRWNEIEPMVNAVYAALGRVDVLVNNAGMSPIYPSLAEVSESYFDSVIGLNLKGPFRLGALVGQRMNEGGAGAIINISSISSIDVSPATLPYAAAKAGLNILSNGFAAAYPNVRSNTIAVGRFGTDVAEHWSDPRDRDRPGFTKAGKRIGRPDEIVGAALYLASDAASYTNAALLRIDGGLHRPGQA